MICTACFNVRFNIQGVQISALKHYRKKIFGLYVHRTLTYIIFEECYLSDFVINFRKCWLLNYLQRRVIYLRLKSVGAVEMVQCTCICIYLLDIILYSCLSDIRSCRNLVFFIIKRKYGKNKAATTYRLHLIILFLKK